MKIREESWCLLQLHNSVLMFFGTTGPFPQLGSQRTPKMKMFRLFLQNKYSSRIAVWQVCRTVISKIPPCSVCCGSCGKLETRVHPALEQKCLIVRKSGFMPVAVEYGDLSAFVYMYNENTPSAETEKD